MGGGGGGVGGGVFFFFQAEDGIRDRDVTGVQTCALRSPTNINYAPESSTFGKIAKVNPPGVQWTGLALGEPPCGSGYLLRQVRSEERL